MTGIGNLYLQFDLLGTIVNFDGAHRRCQVGQFWGSSYLCQRAAAVAGCADRRGSEGGAVQRGSSLLVFGGARRDQLDLFAAQLDLEFIPWFEAEHGGVGLTH